jgi:oligopeptide transport system substrate-binding protein
VRVADAAELIGSALAGRAPLAELSWYADYADPDNFTYVLFHSANEAFFSSNYRNSEVDQLAERARAVMDREERDRLYRQLARVVVDDAPSVFLIHRRNVVAHRPDVEGLRLHLLTPVVRPDEVWFIE